MDVDKEKLRKLFPHLVKELETGEGKIAVRSIRFDTEVGEKKGISSDLFAGYIPDVIDFIRRCENEKQAIEIIEYLENRGEISKDYAENLRVQLREKGLRSFGKKKEHDYYLKKACYG